MTVDEYILKIGKVGRFESLVQMPERFPDSQRWAARGTKNEHGKSTNGKTAEEALKALLKALKVK